MARVVLDFNENNPLEVRIYNYLSNFGNGKKTLIMKALLPEVMAYEREMAGISCSVSSPVSYVVPEKPVKEKKEKVVKEVKENKPEVIRTEPVIETVKEEPVVQTQTTPVVNPVPEPDPVPIPSPAPTPTSSVPPLGGLGGLGGGFSFGITVEEEKDKRLAFLSDADYKTIIQRFDVDEMNEEFLREFQRIYLDNEMYPGGIAQKIQRAQQETYVQLTVKDI